MSEEDRRPEVAVDGASSFGFKFGLPPMRDGSWTRAWCATRSGSPSCARSPGSTSPVRDYVLADEVARELIDHTHSLHVVVIAAVCGSRPGLADHRGRLHRWRHRSVVIVEALAERLRADGLTVAVTHRDVDVPDPRL